MIVNILGTDWVVDRASIDQDDRLNDADGFSDWSTKRIVVRDEKDIYEGTLENMEEYIKKVLRHEIVHAFFLESGLHECSGQVNAWAANETMVDWIARQGPKIYKAWKEAGAL